MGNTHKAPQGLAILGGVISHPALLGEERYAAQQWRSSPPRPTEHRMSANRMKIRIYNQRMNLAPPMPMRRDRRRPSIPVRQAPITRDPEEQEADRER